jgi:hypothetical protein
LPWKGRTIGCRPAADAPADVSSCKGYANWQAHQLGDMLPADKADDLTLLGGLCSLLVALREGLPRLPDLD